MSAFASLFQNPNARCQDYELAPTSDLLQLPQQQLLQQQPLLKQQQQLLESQLQPPPQQQQPGFTLEYVNFPLQLTLTENKEQRGGGPRQYIQDGELSFVLNFHSVDARSNVYLIAVVVAHTNDMNNNKNTSMEVPKVEVNLIQETKTFVKVGNSHFCDDMFMFFEWFFPLNSWHRPLNMFWPWLKLLVILTW